MLEIVTFALKAGADVAAFLAADARVQTEWAYQQPGIVRRTTARGHGGRWAVVTVWSDAAAVDRAAANRGHPAIAEFDVLVDSATFRRELFEGLPG